MGAVRNGALGTSPAAAGAPPGALAGRARPHGRLRVGARFALAFPFGSPARRRAPPLEPGRRVRPLVPRAPLHLHPADAVAGAPAVALRRRRVVEGQRTLLLPPCRRSPPL